MPQKRSLGQVIEDIRTCTTFTLMGAGVLSLYVLGLYVFQGPEPFAQRGMTLGRVVLVYFMAAVLSGTMVGLLLPFGRPKWGKALVGSVAAIPFYGSIRVARHGFAMEAVDLVYIVVVSTIIGSVMGLTLHRTLYGKD